MLLMVNNDLPKKFRAFSSKTHGGDAPHILRGAGRHVIGL